MTNDPEKPGRLLAFKNKDHEPGGKQPAFKGTISIQGSAENRHVVLWARKSKRTGKTYFQGRLGESAAAQIDKLADGHADDETVNDGQETESDLKPGDIRLFPNEQKKPDTNLPDYFGSCLPGKNDKPQRLDVWAKVDKYGKPMLSGNVTEQKPKQEPEQKQDAPKPVKKRQRSMSV
jgi:hypothetical protein